MYYIHRRGPSHDGGDARGGRSLLQGSNRDIIIAATYIIIIIIIIIIVIIMADSDDVDWACPARLEKGEMGSALMGSLQISCFLTEGLFGYSR